MITLGILLNTLLNDVQLQNRQKIAVDNTLSLPL